MGINKNDIDIQYKKFYFLAKKLNSPLYTVYGEKDTFDGASDLYLKYTGRHVYYSFNYGSFHFIILNNIKSLSKQERKKQAQWLKKDIELNKDSSLIFVIAHEPFYSPSGGQLKSGVEADFYKFFKKNRINYVISGGSSKYYMLNKSNTYFYVAGSHERENSKWKKYFRYYIVDVSGLNLMVSERTVEISNK